MTADEELSPHYRPRIRTSVDWFSWVFGLEYEPGANVWSTGIQTVDDPWGVQPNQLLEYPRMLFIHLGPFTVSLTGSVPTKQEWQ